MRIGTRSLRRIGWYVWNEKTLWLQRRSKKTVSVWFQDKDVRSERYDWRGEISSRLSLFVFPAKMEEQNCCLGKEDGCFSRDSPLFGRVTEPAIALRTCLPAHGLPVPARRADEIPPALSCASWPALERGPSTLYPDTLCHPRPHVVDLGKRS